jgi:hypothetical protein
MEAKDYGEFAQKWSVAHEVMPFGKVLSKAAMETCFGALGAFPIQLVIRAIDKHIAFGTQAPQPSDIVAILTQSNQRPTPNEAWGMIEKPLGINHEVSAVLSDEMMKAWSMVEDDYFRDPIGARMSFLAIYESECKKNAHLPIRWKFYEGFGQSETPTQKTKVIQRGIDEGKLLAADFTEKLARLAPPKIESLVMLENHAKKGEPSEAKRKALEAMQALWASNEQEAKNAKNALLKSHQEWTVEKAQEYQKLIQQQDELDKQKNQNNQNNQPPQI